MRWLWHTLAALDGEYGPRIREHVAGDLLAAALVRYSPAGGES